MRTVEWLKSKGYIFVREPALVEPTPLESVPHLLGYSTYEEQYTYLHIAIPPAQRLVIYNTKNYDTMRNFLIDVPWTVMRIIVQAYNGSSCVDPNRILAMTETPTVCLDDVKLFNPGIPNTDPTGGVCIGNVYTSCDNRHSITEVIIAGINAFWESRFNGDLRPNTRPLLDLLPLWEADPDSYLSEALNDDVGYPKFEMDKIFEKYYDGEQLYRIDPITIFAPNLTQVGSANACNGKVIPNLK